jgi:DamX protein
MSFAHEMRVLELESQTELLERLRLLTRFGSNLINLTGPAGAGKTWLAQRFLEAYAEDKNQALLMCHPHQSDEQKRTILLNQVVGDALFNQHDPIIESFSYLIGDQRCDLVIAVDDADQLSGDLIAELWTLVLEAQPNPDWNINVVMFSSGNSLESVLSRLSYGQELKPIALEIESLREHETEMFLELQVMHLVVGEDAKKRVRKDAKKAPPLPGALMALGERKVERKIIIRSIIGSPLKIALMVLILLLFIAGGYIWLLSQPGPQEQMQVLSDEGVVTAQTEQMVLDENGQSNLESASGETQPVADDDATDDAGALPPSITADAASVGSSDEGQRVVVPDTVVDALLEGDTTAQTQVIDQAVELARQQAVLSDTDLPEQTVVQTVVEQTPQAADEPPLEAETQAAQDAPPLVTFSFARDELLAVSDRNYTLQLAAMLSLEEVQDFLLVHELQGQVRIYPTVRAGVDWYIVTYKDYPTIQQARDAREELPQSVQILEPWAKSMLQVHREIARAN